MATSIFDVSDIDFSKQTRKLKDGSRVCCSSKSAHLLKNSHEDVKTCYDLFLKAISLSNNGNFLVWKNNFDEIRGLKYLEVKTISEQIGSSFMSFGVKPNSTDCLCIYSKNSPEWILAENACIAYSIPSVALHENLSDDSISFILNQTQATLVFCENSDKAMKLMRIKGYIKYLIVMDNTISQEAQRQSEYVGIQLVTFLVAIEIGRANHRNPIPPKPETVYTINYTPGTSGITKGVRISHGNAIAVVSSLELALKSAAGISEGIQNGQERYLSYLPLANISERILQLFVTSIGSTSCFLNADLRKVSEDIKFFRPTIFSASPHFLTKIYDQINYNLSVGPLEKRIMFEMAFQAKQKELTRNRTSGQLSVFDKPFVQIKETFGGSTKLMVVGCASLAPQILQFFQVILGADVVQGYGSAETSGMCAMQLPGDEASSAAGAPLPCNQIKLADIAEMGISVKRDKKGQILVRGANVSQGYYSGGYEKSGRVVKEGEEKEGWYETGDVGSFDECGRLRVIDRMQHMFKLSHGEYISPAKLENIYARCAFVSNVFVSGSDSKRSVVAVVVPDEGNVASWCHRNNIPFNYKLVCKSSQFKKMIMQKLEEIAEANELKSSERVKDIYIHDELFSVEKYLLTVNGHLRRPELAKFFRVQIDEMLRKLE